MNNNKDSIGNFVIVLDNYWCWLVIIKLNNNKVKRNVIIKNILEKQ